MLSFLVLSLAACGGGAESGTPDGALDAVDAGDLDAAATTPDANTCTGGTLCGTPATCCPAGNVCIDDQCLAACESGVRCGASLECCDGGQVCLADACVTPGAACGDPYDCDPGNFCEPTLSECLPQPDPLTCESVPMFADLTIMPEWSSTGDQIISIPAVGNLDGAGGPEVVVNLTHQDGGGFVEGSIQILDGTTGAIKVAAIPHNPPTSYGSHGRSTVAIGDVSGDGLPDIIYAARPDGSGRSLIVAIDGTGALLWTSHDAGGAAYGIKVENGAVALANFDDDPMAEIVLGATLLDHDGLVVWDQGGDGKGGFVGTNSTYNGGVSAIADLDGDGQPEIVSGRDAWKVAWNAATPNATEVTSYWRYGDSTNDGYPAVADFDQDGAPEIVLVSRGTVTVLDGQTGVRFCAIDPSGAMCTASPSLRVQPIAIPGGASHNIGGPPTVADFDADGRPEIGVAGGHSYSVYDLARPGEDTTGITPTPAAGQLFVRWSNATQDLSSNATGSSVFDFQGDGSSEVIYQDECNVWVYSGTDGRPQLQLPNTTGTIHEYPLVVDVDGDGNSEIIIVANDANAAINCPGQPTRRGIFVYGDPEDRWVPTRKVWTQHSYHVTNATSAGNVPMAELANWEQPGLNDYRKNAQGAGVFNAPDVAVELAVGLDQCVDGQILLDARVTNLGALGVPPGVTVAFYEGTDASGPMLGTSTTPAPILPGGSTHATLAIPEPTMATDYFAVVDSAGTVDECDETNNEDDVAGATCISPE